MSEVSEFLDRNRPAIFGVTGVLLALSLLFICWRIGRSMRSTNTPDRVSQSYFYDLNTGHIFVAPDQEGPIETDSGMFEGHPAGVKAVVFSCGSCREESERFVGWLEMPDPDFAEIETDSEGGSGDSEEPSGTLIRSATGSKWVAAESREADKIMTEAGRHCGSDGSPKYCHPPSALAQ